MKASMFCISKMLQLIITSATYYTSVLPVSFSASPTQLSRVLLHHCLLFLLSSVQMPVLGVTQSEITGYTFNYILINNSNASYMMEPVPTVQTSHRFNAAQLGNSYNVFLTATNDGGVSNASESLNLCKQCCT